MIDYSKTINRFTYLNTYLLPRIDSIVSELATYNVFSTIDLKSAHHQIELHPQVNLFFSFLHRISIGKWLVSMATITIWTDQCSSEISTSYRLLHQEKQFEDCNLILMTSRFPESIKNTMTKILNAFLKAAAAAKMTINKTKRCFCKKKFLSH